MNKIPGFESYSESEKKIVLEKSSAISRYYQQIKLVANVDEDHVRQKRNEIWLDCAASSLSQKNTAKNICQYWSAQADYFLKSAFEKFFDQNQYTLLALGKLGASELNLSSDVDLLILSTNDAPDGIPQLRKFQKYLADKTPFGFVFRVDFDLRPGGKHGPMIATIDQFKDYYGNYGEAWERLALVRLRTLAGSEQISNEAHLFSEQFCYRRHLDFTLLEDLKLLRKKIHAEYWKRTQENQTDLKLGIGGIRDIELFVHALLVIHGGKNKNVRDKGTAEALEKIKKEKILPADDCDFLSQLYWDLRNYENQVQAIEDAQTHILMNPPKDLKPRLEKCSHLVAGLIGELPEILNQNESMSNLPIELQEHWAEIMDIHALSRNKERDEQTRLVFLQKFFHALQTHHGNTSQALLLLKDFIRATRAKASFFAMLVREEKLLHELAWIFGQSPYLSRILCFRPELLDSFVYRSQDLATDDLQILLEQLAEKKQLSELINGTEFLKERDTLKLCQKLSQTADEILLLLITALKKEYPSDISILAMGKWGGQEMGFCSDLDFIFVSPNEPIDADFKFAKRLISRLTEPHKGGRIYPIDMRLRPSGSAGPLVTSQAQLKDYLQSSASAWERQAYLKARWVGEKLFEIDSFQKKGLSQLELKELDRIRLELLPKKNILDIKYAAGGLIDLEFTTQILCLKNSVSIKNGNTIELMKSAQMPTALLLNYVQMRQYEQVQQLFTTEASAEFDPNHESFHSLATLLNLSKDDLEKQMSSILSKNIQILEQLDPRRLSG